MLYILWFEGFYFIFFTKYIIRNLYCIYANQTILLRFIAFRQHLLCMVVGVCIGVRHRCLFLDSTNHKKNRIPDTRGLWVVLYFRGISHATNVGLDTFFFSPLRTKNPQTPTSPQVRGRWINSECTETPASHGHRVIMGLQSGTTSS